MAFLAVLKRDFNTLFKCTSYRRRLTSIRINNTASKNKFGLCRFYSEEKMFSFLPKLISTKTVAQLIKKDGIPDNFELIYRVKESFAFTVMHITIVLVAGTVPAMVYTLAKNNNFKLPFKFMDNFVIYDKAQLLLALCVPSLIFSLSCLLVYRFPLRIYFNKKSDEYIAVYTNIFLPLRTARWNFKRGETKADEIPKYLPVQMSNYIINGRKSILVEDNFVRPMDLYYMINKEPGSD